MSRQPVLKARPETLDEYLSLLEPATREEFGRLLDLLRASTPGAVLRMRHNMPFLLVDDYIVCAVARQKHYFAIYIDERDLIEKHLAALGHLDIGKSCIRFKRLEQIPAPIVRRLLGDVLARAKAARKGKRTEGRK